MQSEAQDDQQPGDEQRRLRHVLTALAVVGGALCVLSVWALVRHVRGDASSPEVPLQTTIDRVARELQGGSARHPSELYVCLRGRITTTQPLAGAADGGGSQACVLVRQSIIEEVQLEQRSSVAGETRILSEQTVVADSVQEAPCLLDDSTGRLPLVLHPPPATARMRTLETRVEAKPDSVVRLGTLEHRVPSELKTWRGELKREIVTYLLRESVIPAGHEAQLCGVVRRTSEGLQMTAESQPRRPFRLTLLDPGQGAPPVPGRNLVNPLLGMAAGAAGLICLVCAVLLLGELRRLAGQTAGDETGD